MHSQSNRNDIKNKRDSFRKQVRKAIVNTKLQSLRKTLILDAHLWNPTQMQSQSLPTPNYELLPSDKTISDLLKILDKFISKQISKCEYSHIKKFGQKLDAAVFVLAHIERLIIDGNALKSLEQEMGNLSIQKIELQSQSLKSCKLNDLQQIEELKASTWQPKRDCTKLETLKQIWQITLLIKINTFIQSMEEFTQSFDYPSRTKYSQLIPLGVVKWLYFSYQNMNIYLNPHEKPPRKVVNSFLIHDHTLVFSQSYCEVSSRMIQLFTIGQINEIFFNPIDQIRFMKDLIHPQFNEAELDLDENYIDCSPYQFLIHACDQSQNFLIKLRDNLQMKTNQCQKFLVIQQIKIENLQNYPFEYGNFMEQHKNELMKSLELLSMLQKYHIQNS